MKLIKNVRFRLFLVWCWCCLSGPVLWAQAEQDSLLAQAQKRTTDSLIQVSVKAPTLPMQVDALNDLCRTFRFTNPDTAYVYAMRALELATRGGYERGQANAHNHIGAIFWIQGDYVDALESHLEALHIREKMQDYPGQGSSLVNIGLVYQSQGNYAESISYYERCLKMGERSGDRHSVGAALANLGEVYKLQGKYETSLEHFGRALPIFQEMQDQGALSEILSGMAKVYLLENSPQEALGYATQSYQVAQQVNNRVIMSEALNIMARVYQKQRNYAEAVSHAEEALAMGRRIGSKERIKDAAHTLSEVCYQKGDHRQAYLYLALLNSVKDSLFSGDKTRAINNLERQRERQKVELERQKQDLALRAQRVTNYALIAGLGLVFAVAFFFFREQRRTKQANSQLIEKNDEITRKSTDLLRANDEITRKNALIEKKNADITASINYARRIQQAMLPDIKVIRFLLPDLFIFFKPRDIVSGDFYWFNEKQGKLFLAAVDCTGHGVPGAFMSMIGDSLLTQIVNDKEIFSPDEILREIHIGIRAALRQEDTRSRDGMDLALVVIDCDSRTMQFAGAMNSLFMVQHDAEGNPQPVLVRGDRKPIGGDQHEEDQLYTLHHIPLDPPSAPYPTAYYLYSDGYQDQTGGKFSTKFMSRNFRELLVSIHEMPAEEQRDALEYHFEQWKGTHPQVDDVLVIGFKVV